MCTSSLMLLLQSGSQTPSLNGSGALELASTGNKKEIIVWFWKDRAILISCSLWISTSRGSKLPYIEDTQAVLWPSPHSEELSPLETPWTLHLIIRLWHEWAFLEADLPVPFQPSDDWLLIGTLWETQSPEPPLSYLWIPDFLFGMMKMFWNYTVMMVYNL